MVTDKVPRAVYKLGVQRNVSLAQGYWFNQQWGLWFLANPNEAAGIVVNEAGDYLRYLQDEQGHLPSYLGAKGFTHVANPEVG